MFSGFFGWHLLFIVGVLVLVGLLAWGVYWVTGRAAARGARRTERGVEE